MATSPFSAKNSLGGSAFKSDPYFEAKDVGKGGVFAVESITRKDTKARAGSVFLSLVCLIPPTNRDGGATMKVGEKRNIGTAIPSAVASDIALQTIGKFEVCAARIPRLDEQSNEAIRAACTVMGTALPARFGDGFDMDTEADSALGMRATVLTSLHEWAVAGEGRNLSALGHADGIGIVVLDMGTKAAKDDPSRLYVNHYPSPLDLGVDAEGNATVGPVTEALAKAIVDGTIPAALAKSVLSPGFIENCTAIVGADTTAA